MRVIHPSIYVLLYESTGGETKGAMRTKFSNAS